VDSFTMFHKNNIYHNDVNHRNIILGEDGKIYIIDFDKTTSTLKANKANIDPKYLDTYR
jgi:thiamine kinase-like enzyme